MALKYNVPIETTYYGFSLFYRMERRNGHPTIILSYRQDGKIIYEHPPRRLKGDVPTDGLPIEILEEFFQSLFSVDLPAKNRERGLALRHALVNLPLAVLFLADSFALFKDPTLKRKKASIEDDERAIALLLQYEGHTPWREVTPAKCSSWMYGRNRSDHARTSVKRVMRSLFLRQAEERIIEAIPWCNYDPNAASRPRQNFRSLIRTNVDPTTLTDGQCQALLTPITKAIQRGTVSGLDIALLLRLTLALPLEEICALNLGDFCFLQDYPRRLTVNITYYTVCAERQHSYRRLPLTDPYKIRKLPLASCVRDAIEAYRGQKSTGSSVQSVPLVPHKSNNQRHMRPDDLRKEMEKRFALIPKQGTITKGRTPSFHELSNRTAPRELLKSGFEEEELRFLLGQAPKLVSAQSYADFLNEAELNKMGALQNRWLRRLWPEQTKARCPKTEKLSGKNSLLRYAGPKRACTQATIQIMIPPTAPAVLDSMPTEGVLLELGACYGCSGHIIFSSNQGDFENEQ